MHKFFIEMKKIVFVHSPDYYLLCSTTPFNPYRSLLVHSLIKATGLLDDDNIEILEPKEATNEILRMYHSHEYLNFLEKVGSFDEKQIKNNDIDPDDWNAFGLGEVDTPIFPNLIKYSKLVVGSSVEAADVLASGKAMRAIHWEGGRHHASAEHAGGYCYLNDIVLSVMRLLDRFDKICVVDIDYHHSDAVQEAFYFTDRVLTTSYHHFGPGIFPGTGKLTEIGSGKGKFYNVNVPFHDGINGEVFCEIFDKIWGKVSEIYCPDAVVFVCGCDSLAKDSVGKFNLSTNDFVHCISAVVNSEYPVLFLGGGGYNSENCARCWTLCTAAILEREILDEVPEHEYLERYSPDFKLNVKPNHVRDENIREYVADLLNAIHDNLQQIRRKKSTRRLTNRIPT